MKIRVSLDLITPDSLEDTYAAAAAYMRYEYGDVPRHLLSDQAEEDFPETTLNLVETVVFDIVRAGIDSDAEGALDDWGIDRMHVEVV